MNPFLEPCTQANQRRPCALCSLQNTVDASVATHYCGKCKIVCYCSKAHQQAHWAVHAKTCVPVSPTRATAYKKLFAQLGYYEVDGEQFALPFRPTSECTALFAQFEELTKSGTDEKTALATLLPDDAFKQYHFDSDRVRIPCEFPDLFSAKKLPVHRSSIYNMLPSAFHALLPPATIADIQQFCAKNGITKIVDCVGNQGEVSLLLQAHGVPPGMTVSFDSARPAIEMNMAPTTFRNILSPPIFAKFDPAQTLYILANCDNLYCSKALNTSSVLMSMIKHKVKHVLFSERSSTRSDLTRRLLSEYFKPSKEISATEFKLSDGNALKDIIMRNRVEPLRKLLESMDVDFEFMTPAEFLAMKTSPDKRPKKKESNFVVQTLTFFVAAK
jgi:hypothetical protein